MDTDKQKLRLQYTDLGPKRHRNTSNIYFSHGHHRKAGRELQTELDRIMNNGGTLSKNQPEPVTGPWVYTEAVYLFVVLIWPFSMQIFKMMASLQTTSIYSDFCGKCLIIYSSNICQIILAFPFRWWKMKLYNVILLTWYCLLIIPSQEDMSEASASARVIREEIVVARTRHQVGITTLFFKLIPLDWSS